jgi:hypothetical protein
LTRNIEISLTSSIKVMNPDSESVTTYRDLLWHWDNETGFSEFVKVRIGQIKAMDSRMNDEAILKHLTKFGNRPAEGSKGWPGWLLWKEQHPNLTNEVAATEIDELQRQLNEGVVIEDSRFASLGGE